MPRSKITIYNKICWEGYSNIFNTSPSRLILDFKNLNYFGIFYFQSEIYAVLTHFFQEFRWRHLDYVRLWREVSGNMVFV